MTTTKDKPKIVELRSNIYQIYSDRPGSIVYLIKGLVKNVLIDTGMASNLPNLKDCLAEVGVELANIHLVILTHEHFDHIGASCFLHESAVLAAHRLTANKLYLQDQFVMMSDYFDRLAKPFSVDISLSTDSTIELGNYRLCGIHTPGHTSGCICLYEPDHKLLFTGDTFLARSILSGVFGSGSLSDYLMSLQLLSELKVEALYPGHGRISTSPQEDLLKALENSQTLLEESKILFEAIDTKATFEHLFFSWRKFPLHPES